MLSKMHTMRCMYRIWKSKVLLYRRSDLYEPLRVMPTSVHREIRGMARSAMSSAERDILSNIDKFMKSTIRKNDKLPIWVCMMQLILTYRDLLDFTEAYQMGIAGAEASKLFTPPYARTRPLIFRHSTGISDSQQDSRSY